MEPIEFLLDISCCLLEFVDFAAIITNIVAWTKSAPHRAARKEAKTTGAEPPPRDTWFQVLVFMTPIALTLTGIVIYKWVRWLMR
jgi:hypothetical protein